MLPRYLRSKKTPIDRIDDQLVDDPVRVLEFWPIAMQQDAKCSGDNDIR